MKFVARIQAVCSQAEPPPQSGLGAELSPREPVTFQQVASCETANAELGFASHSIVVASGRPLVGDRCANRLVSGRSLVLSEVSSSHLSQFDKLKVAINGCPHGYARRWHWCLLTQPDPRVCRLLTPLVVGRCGNLVSTTMKEMVADGSCITAMQTVVGQFGIMYLPKGGIIQVDVHDRKSIAVLRAARKRYAWLSVMGSSLPLPEECCVCEPEGMGDRQLASMFECLNTCDIEDTHILSLAVRRSQEGSWNNVARRRNRDGKPSRSQRTQRSVGYASPAECWSSNMSSNPRDSRLSSSHGEVTEGDDMPGKKQPPRKGNSGPKSSEKALLEANRVHIDTNNALKDVIAELKKEKVEAVVLPRQIGVHEMRSPDVKMCSYVHGPAPLNAPIGWSSPEGPECELIQFTCMPPEWHCYDTTVADLERSGCARINANGLDAPIHRMLANAVVRKRIIGCALASLTLVFSSLVTRRCPVRISMLIVSSWSWWLYQVSKRMSIVPFCRIISVKVLSVGIIPIVGDASPIDVRPCNWSDTKLLAHTDERATVVECVEIYTRTRGPGIGVWSVLSSAYSWLISQVRGCPMTFSARDVFGVERSAESLNSGWLRERRVADALGGEFFYRTTTAHASRTFDFRKAEACYGGTLGKLRSDMEAFILRYTRFRDINTQWDGLEAAQSASLWVSARNMSAVCTFNLNRCPSKPAPGLFGDTAQAS